MTPGAIEHHVNIQSSQRTLVDHAEFMVEALAASTLCEGLEWAEVAMLARHAEMRDFSSLNEVVAEGERPRELHVVVRGRFIALLPSQQLDKHGAGAIVNLDSFVAGDCFGQSGLVGDCVAPAAIIATERSEALAIPLAALERVANADQNVGRAIYRNLFAIQTRRLALLSG